MIDAADDPAATSPTPVTVTDAAVLERREPFVKPLIASLAIFGAYAALARTAAHQGWILESRYVGLAAFVTACFGLTVITVFSAVAWPMRMLAGRLPLIGKHLFEWKEPEPDGLLACAMCSGMWIGSILAALGLSVYPVRGALDLVIHGLIGSGATWLLYAITHKLGVYGNH